MSRYNFKHVTRRVPAFVIASLGMALGTGCEYICLGQKCVENATATSGAQEWAPYWLRCRGLDDSSRDICVKDSWCEGYTPEEICTFHWAGAIGAYPEGGWFVFYYVDAYGSCDSNDEPTALLPCYPHPNPETTGNDPITTGAVTTGETGDSGDDEEKWRFCDEYSHEKCFLFYSPFWDEDAQDAISDPSNHSKCWSVPPKWPCFYGKKSAVLDSCYTDCTTERTNSVGDCIDVGDVLVEDTPGEPYNDWYCENLENTIVDVLPGYEHLCDGILPAWEGAPVKRFTATVLAAGAGGGSTSQSNIRGYLALRTENCTSTKCDLIIEALEGSARDVAGVYTLPDGSQLTYTAEDFDFRIMQQLRGEWHLARGNVTFPTSAAKVTVWANSISVEQVPLPDSRGGASVEQIVGSYRNGTLMLTLTYSSAGSMVVASLQTID